MHRYKIPQNVQIEDKIFGNILTLKQLIVIGIGGAISYIIYTILARAYTLNFLEIGFIAIPLLISISFAFIKIGPLSLFQYTLLFLEYILKPEQRIWIKQGALGLSIAQEIPIKKEEKKGELKKDKKIIKLTKTELKSLSNQDKLKAIKKISGTLDFSKTIKEHPFKREF